ncbi:MAG: isovaleryl-CoA dehydrogenase [Proteobacteria bacterium]|nr:isovaleryl-CoA dehydrogenase [Pseudomonadota bacterium]MCP4920368.1 isovaleryl-CoA dehydrogenase [Pseudomonadota bacterium]
MCRDFTRAEVEGQAAEYDDKQCLNIPLFRQLGELGLLGITVPEEYGGSGMDSTAAVIAHHEISKSDPGFCLAYLAHSMLFVNNFFYCSNDEQKGRWLDGVITGELIGGMAMTEPGYGTDVLGMTTTAELRGDVYVMNGTKTFITNGPEGHIFLVYAKVDGRTTAFAVTSDLPGFGKSEHIEKMGMRASSMSELIFEDCEVPVANVLGAVGGGLTHMMRNLEIERLTLAAMSLGIADRCMEMMVHYANERISFGAPLNRHGQIQRYIGESYANTEAMRALVYNVALSVGPDKRNRLGSDAAKLYAGPVAKQVADNAMQVFGGNGYCREYPIERLLRDAKLIEIGGGTIESHQKNITKDLTKALG